MDADKHKKMSTAQHVSSKPKQKATGALLDGPTLTKAGLAALLFERLGLNKQEAKNLIDAFFNVICETLENGENVKLPGFGNFQLLDKAQRPGRNPKTGEAVPIAARRVVTFQASQKLKAAVETNLREISAQETRAFF
jgi:integration host factor subunit alpha